MDYDACVFLGARRKGQRIRHSLQELQQLPPLRCGHVHSGDEWRRTGAEFPTFAEAEYTPSLVFTLAICATAWAVKHGYAIEAIPRLPPIQISGDVRPLLQFPPACLRQDLMDVMGFHLGLNPPVVRSDFVPRRLVAADRLLHGKSLEKSEIYIGDGHFSHRWNPTMWSNPFKKGRHGSGLEVVLKYSQWIPEQAQLLAQLDSLVGGTLVCDCAANQLCHGDVLRALVWHRHSPGRGHGPQPATSTRTVALLAGGARLVQAIPLRFSQAELIAAFTSLCIGIDLSGFQWPCIEDLANEGVALQFLQSSQHDQWTGRDQGPSSAGPAERTVVALSGLHQSGAGSSSKALPPLIPFGLGADEHFRLALEAQKHPAPFEEMGIVDKDLMFAAAELEHHGLLRGPRQHMIRWTQELARRWQPVTVKLQDSQAAGPRAATRGRHLALIALLMILIGWPDPTFPGCLIWGFPAVGYSPPVDVYQSQPAQFLDMRAVLHDGFRDAQALIPTLLPSEFDEEIVKAGSEDEAKGFCGGAMSWEELCQIRRLLRQTSQDGPQLLQSGSAHWFAIQLAECLGSPFADSKHQQMGPSADFLGLDHEIGQTIVRGALHFWVGPRPIEKMQDVINEALANPRLLPGVASKLFGGLSFLNASWADTIRRMPGLWWVCPYSEVVATMKSWTLWQEQLAPFSCVVVLCLLWVGMLWR